MSPFQSPSHSPLTNPPIQFEELQAVFTLACILAARSQTCLFAYFSYSLILHFCGLLMHADWFFFSTLLSYLSYILNDERVREKGKLSEISKLGSIKVRWLNIQHKKLLQHLKRLRNSSKIHLFHNSLSFLTQVCKIAKKWFSLNASHFWCPTSRLGYTSSSCPSMVKPWLRSWQSPKHIYCFYSWTKLLPFAAAEGDRGRNGTWCSKRTG